MAATVGSPCAEVGHPKVTALVILPRHVAPDPQAVEIRVKWDQRHAERRKGTSRQGGHRATQRRIYRRTFQAAVVVLA